MVLKRKHLRLSVVAAEETANSRPAEGEARFYVQIQHGPFIHVQRNEDLESYNGHCGGV